MITIVAALKGELLPLIKYFSAAGREPFGQGILYFSNEMHFFLTGVGAHNVEQTFGKYLQKYRPGYILNIGLAGSLGAQWPIHEIYAVEQISDMEREKIIRLSIHEIFRDLQRVRLLTVHEALSDSSSRDELLKEDKGNLVDMEAFSLAAAARTRGIPFNSIKIVSDHADHMAREDFMKNYRKLASQLASYLIKRLNRLNEYYS